MLNVKNQKCIRQLGNKSMKASRNRNLIAIIAIALTTLLFTSLFTIAMTINDSFQQQTFRQVGGNQHGSIKDVTWEQAEQLRADPLITSSSVRLFVGMTGSEVPFNKAHVEVSYMEDPASYFCTPTSGTLPEEDTDQIATDTRVLGLLGIEPKVGAKVTLPFELDGSTTNPTPVTRTFTLSGWWEYDSACIASHVVLPRSAAEELCALSSGAADSMTGRWDLNVNFRSSLHIRENVETVLANHGYQNDDPLADNFLKIGVNWGYTGAQTDAKMDPITTGILVGVLALIIFTGYLIIFNVFQISVTNDIRFYGLLKTIGTTKKQIKRIIRRQALLLSALGIPIGLVLGWLIGGVLTPLVMEQTIYKAAGASLSPVVFLGSAVFALLTVLLSCAKPGRMAARVSPVEAVRYTDVGGGKKKAKKSKGVSLLSMAWANLGRNKSKTVVTVLSLSLAVVLVTLTFSIVGGMDMEKYVSHSFTTDFVLGDAAYFQSNFASADQVLDENIIAGVEARDGITDSGRIYGQTTLSQQFITEQRIQELYSAYQSYEDIGDRLRRMEQREDGLYAGDALVYGLEDFPLSLVDVLEGDIVPLRDPSQNAVAAVWQVDDYGQPIEGTHWANIGDTVTLRYPSRFEYYWVDTGELIEDVDAVYNSNTDRQFGIRAAEYREQTYTVCALVQLPFSMTYRHTVLGADEYLLGAAQYLQDSDQVGVMNFMFNTTDEANADMEAFIADYTEHVQPSADYESRQTFIDEFNGFRNMFLTLGGALSFIIGLVGVLNFLNAILTGILSRKREFAMLQSIGMTGAQLKRMLMLEGVLYAISAIVFSLLLSLLFGPPVAWLLETIFWFFSYHLALMPIFLLAPLFVLLGALIPLFVYRSAAKSTIVERLRETET